MRPVIYKRFILDSGHGVEVTTTEVFFYICVLPGAPKIQIGLGYESLNGLQKRHYANWNVTRQFLLNLANMPDVLLARVKTGPLADLFGGREYLDLGSDDPELVEKVSGALYDIHMALVLNSEQPIHLGSDSLRDTLDSIAVFRDTPAIS